MYFAYILVIPCTISLSSHIVCHQLYNYCEYYYHIKGIDKITFTSYSKQHPFNLSKERDELFSSL